MILKLYFTNREIVDSIKQYSPVTQMVLGLQGKTGRRRVDLWTRRVSEERQEPLYDGRPIRLTSEEGVRLRPIDYTPAASQSGLDEGNCDAAEAPGCFVSPYIFCKNNGFTS